MISLSELEEEYRVLSMRLAAIARTIEAYGGTLPSAIASERKEPVKEAATPLAVPALFPHDPYPQNAGWKQRIDWAITYGGESTAQQLSDNIVKFEPALDPEMVNRMVTQYASAMSIGDKATLAARKIGKKNAYKFK